MNWLVKKVVAWWLMRNYGRCLDYKKGCAACDAWQAWGYWVAKYMDIE